MNLRSSSGQITIEAVLLVALFVITINLISQQMRANRVIQSLVTGPWVYLQGMIEAGVWAPPAQARAAHPNNKARQQTVRGDGSE